LTDAGVRRYGFHGLSYEYIASVLPERIPQASVGKTVVLHLGAVQACAPYLRAAVLPARWVFSALDGLAMGTRCGSLDPGVILFLSSSGRWTCARSKNFSTVQSGLLGVSGISSDVRVLLESQDPRAKLALDLYVYRIGRELGRWRRLLADWTPSSYAGVGKMRQDSRGGLSHTRHGWAEIGPAAKQRRTRISATGAT